MSILSRDTEDALRRATEEQRLERRGAISEAILAHYNEGPEKLLATLIQQFGTSGKKALTDDKGLIKTRVETQGNEYVFVTRIDNEQLKDHRYGGTEEDFPGARKMNIELRRRARNEAHARMAAASAFLDELRIPHDIKRNKDGGWEVRVHENTIDSVMEPVGQGKLETGSGIHEAMRQFWRDRDEHPALQHGQVAGSKAAEALGKRYFAENVEVGR